MHGAEESACSVETYQSKEGEKIFRVMNIVDLAQRDPRDLVGIMGIKQVQEEEPAQRRREGEDAEASGEERKEESPKEKELLEQENIEEKREEERDWEEKKGVLETLIKNCLVCNVPLSENSFSIFCSRCLIIEDSNLYNSI